MLREKVRDSANLYAGNEAVLIIRRVSGRKIVTVAAADTRERERDHLFARAEKRRKLTGERLRAGSVGVRGGGVVVSPRGK